MEESRGLFLWRDLRRRLEPTVSADFARLVGNKSFSKAKARMSTVTFWSANIIVAILFGLGHLPNAAMVMHITPSVVVLALVLNGIAAIPFGYLYWKRGLESAMIAHFCADFVIYVVGPAFLKS